MKLRQKLLVVLRDVTSQAAKRCEPFYAKHELLLWQARGVVAVACLAVCVGGAWWVQAVAIASAPARVARSPWCSAAGAVGLGIWATMSAVSAYRSGWRGDASPTFLVAALATLASVQACLAVG